MDEPSSDEPATPLSVRPGNQAGWTLPLYGKDRCIAFGHELGDLFEYNSGLLVGYCVRCNDRAEIPWFRGGTMAALAKGMAEEAVRVTNPASSVLEDLDQVLGLLGDDTRHLEAVTDMVRNVRRVIATRLSK